MGCSALPSPPGKAHLALEIGPEGLAEAEADSRGHSGRLAIRMGLFGILEMGL
jgi:hypothetical protein